MRSLFSRLSVLFVGVLAFVIAVFAGARAQYPDPPTYTAEPPAAVAQPDPDEPFLIEGLPPGAAVDVAKQRAEIESRRLYGANARGLYSSLFVWPQTVAKINVCFFDGSDELRRFVVEVASEWRTAAKAPLDFGDPARPRSCSPTATDQHIRITFANTGQIWSALGRQSILMPRTFPLNKPSMNLGFDAGLAINKKRRAVLHEFGHALGLEHEHQSPKGACISEYDREKLFSFLRDTKGWTDEQITLQLGLMDKKGIIATEFDKDSIMIYGFPAKYYRAGQLSHCYAAERERLSAMDAKLVSDLYPSSQELAVAFAEQRVMFLANRADGPVLRGARDPFVDDKVADDVDAFIAALKDDLRSAGRKP